VPHSKALNWTQVETVVEQHCRETLRVLALGELAYQDLLEAFAANGGTDQLFADVLFETTATADQVAMVTDAKNAMIAIHELTNALNNIAVSASNRDQALFRMA
jgi:hypothetical protein